MDCALLDDGIMNPEARVKAYLDANRGSLRFASIDEIVQQVQLYVFYGNSPMADEEVRKIVARWAILNPVRLVPDPPAANPPVAGSATPPLDSAFVDAVKKAVTTVVDGVTIGKKASNLNIGVTGLTANLKQGERGASLGISWGGTLKLEARSGPFYFSGSVAKDKWEITLSFPEDTPVPDLSTLGNIFTEGERAVRNIAIATGNLTDITDAGTKGGQIKPHIAAVQSAVEAASGIAKADKNGGMSFGFKVGSPEPGPGEQTIPAGVQGMGVITWWF